MTDVKKWSVPVVLNQLKRVYSGGLVSQVVLGEKLQVASHSDDETLLVLWKGGNKELLPHTVGVMDLGLLLTAIDQAGEYAHVYLDGPRLVVEGEESRSSVRLVTAHTDQVRNQVDEDQMNRFKEELDQYPVQPVPAEALQAVTRAQRTLGSDYLAMKVGPNGALFTVGSDTENRAEIEVPELTWEQEYEILLPAEVFSKVVNLMFDDSTVDVRLTGPDSVIELSQATVRHIISDIISDA